MCASASGRSAPKSPRSRCTGSTFERPNRVRQLQATGTRVVSVVGQHRHLEPVRRPRRTLCVSASTPKWARPRPSPCPAVSDFSSPAAASAAGCRRGWRRRSRPECIPLLDQRQRGSEQPTCGVQHRLLWIVAYGSVCERVARVKSSKRSRSTTVRPDPAAPRASCASPGRPARRARRRFPRRSPAQRDCEPIEPRRRPTRTRRGSRLCASAWRCRPDGVPEQAHEPASSSQATWPTVSIP